MARLRETVQVLDTLALCDMLNSKFADQGVTFSFK